MSLCEKNCVFKGYNLDKKTALCECKIKTVFHYISELIDNKDKLLNSFLDINTITNLYALKCMNIFFSEEGFKKNIGSYILLIINLVNIFLFIIYIIKRKYYLQEMMNKNIKKDNQKKNNDNLPIKNIENKIINIQKKHQCHHNKKKEKQRNNCIIKTNGDLSVKSYSKIEFTNFQKLVDSENKKVIEKASDNNIEKYNKKKITNAVNVKNVQYNEYEINLLSYEDALTIDKRNYFQYYLSLINRKNLILFSFFINYDNNLKIIKISAFLLSFSLTYAISALFFNDSTMHKIYIDEGNFDFLYQIPQIIYSTIITNIISFIINFLSLSEKDIFDIKNTINKNEIQNEFNKKILIINKKIILYFIIDFLLLIFSWLYLGCFCAVYKNTQIHLIKDTLISFLISLIYPMFICLLPGIFRIPAIKAKKKDKETLYIISKLIQII